MKRHSFRLLFVAAAVCVATGTITGGAPAGAARDVLVQRLRCEYLADPLGIDVRRPRLGWALQSVRRGQRQSAYRILVASSLEKLRSGEGDLWDTGKVASDRSAHIAYAGRPLRSRRHCFWKVRVWDKNGSASAYSAPAFWSMGLLDPKDWRGQWIGHTPAPQKAAPNPDPAVSLDGAFWIWFPEGDPAVSVPNETRFFVRRVALPTDRRVVNARLRVAADNNAVIYVNGREVGRSADSWKRRHQIDVTAHLRPGGNAVAVAVTNTGTAAGLAARLRVEFASGAPMTVATDRDWRAGDRAPTGWNAPAFDGSAWRTAREVVPVGGGPWGTVSDELAPPPAPPAPHLRRAFTLDGTVKRATVSICGLGYYELRMNGRKVGDHVLDPGYTRYDKRALYVTYDVTPYLRAGRNALGVILGTGWYDNHVLAVWDFEKAPWRSRPKLLLDLHVEFADGRTETIVSDARWKASSGPILLDSIYRGEDYDARREKPGWDTAGYDDRSWASANLVQPPKGVLAAQMMPPIRVTQTLAPVKLTEPKPGVFLYDLGQNFAGVPRLRVKGPAGATVLLRCGEKLHADGTLDTGNIEGFVKQRDSAQRFQTDSYTLKGVGTEVWQPRFTYHGFRYVEMTGFPGKPTLENLRGLVLHSDFRPVGQFACSDPLLNRIQQNTLWSYRSNYHGIPTDCPHREKNGWTGDAHLAAEQGLLNYDSAAHYVKWLDDLRDEQRPNGALPGIVPTSGWGYQWGNGPAWDSAYPLIVWYLYEYHGDTHILAKHYDRLRRYVDYLTTRSKNGIVGIGLDDWVAPKTKTPLEVTDTGYYYRDARIVADAARVLGKREDARKYEALAAGIKRAFNARFFDARTGLYANGSLTGLSCALYQGLVEPQHRDVVVRNLVAEAQKQGYHMDVGILGAKYLLNTLADHGRADVAFLIATQTTAPSYGDWIRRGATTLWEDWTGGASRNHIMFGDISAWFYKYVAGINAGAPGFKRIVIKPHILGDLTFARAAYDSVHGRIRSEWKKRNDTFVLSVVIPSNTTATVFVPAARDAVVTEGGVPATRANGVRLVRREAGYAVFAVDSGSYRFAVRSGGAAGRTAANTGR